MTGEDDSGLPAHVPVEDAAELLKWSVPLLAEAIREGRVICGVVAREDWTGTLVTVGVKNDSGSPDGDKLVVGRKDDYRPTGFWCLAPDDAYPIVRDGRGEVGTVVEWWHRLRKYQGASLHFASPLSLDRSQVLVVRRTLPGPSDRGASPTEPARLPLVQRDELSVGEITGLEFPGRAKAQNLWFREMLKAILRGALPAREADRRWLVTRENYRIWRQRLPSSERMRGGRCYILDWLRAEPVVLPKPELESEPESEQGEPVALRLGATGESWLLYAQAKAFLNATDADMCAWTLHRGFRPNSGLVAYKRFNGRLSEFDWSKDATPDFPWFDQLAVLRFSRAEVENFQPDPDPDLRHLTYPEAVERVRKTHSQLSRASIENRLMLVAMAKRGELNLDLVAIDPLAAKRELKRETLPECLFIADQIDRFARECGEDQSAGIAPATTEPGESAPIVPVADTGAADHRTVLADAGRRNANLQHAERNRLYAEIRETVRQLWAKGDPRLHSDMAGHFHGQHPSLSLAELRKKLADLAREINRPDLIRGTKKKG